MRSRDAALTAVHERLTRAATDQDLSEILTEEALREAEELKTLTDPGEDLDAAYVLGTFHWFRHLALPDGADRDDLTAAARFFAPVFQANPEAVPEPLHGLYQPGRGQQIGPDMAALNNRAVEMLTAYERTAEVSRLTEAIELFRAAAAIGPVGDRYRAMVLSNLASVLQTLSARTGNTAALAEAVRVRSDAVAATPVGHPERSTYLSNFGNALRELAERTGDITVLAEAVQALRDAVAAMPIGHPDCGVVLSNLAGALQAQFEGTRDAAAIAEAVQALRKADDATPADHPDRTAILTNLADALQTQFESTGDAAAIAEAVKARREVVDANPANHPNRATYLSNLGNALRALSARTDDTAMQAEAVQVGWDAVAATQADHPSRAAILNNHGIAVQELSARTGDTAMLAEAVGLFRNAVAATPADNPNRAWHLNNLGNALQALSARTGDTALLAEAVALFRAIVATTGADHPNRTAILANLGKALQVWSARTGDVAVLQEAAQAGREAVAATPGDHPDRAGRLSDFGGTLQALYRHTGDTSVLAEAVQAGRDAAAAPDDHSSRAAILNNLGNALQALYERTGDSALLTQAVQAARDAVAATPTGHPERAMYVSNLGNALKMLAERTGDISQLQEAAQAGRDATAATPASHPDHARHLSNFAAALVELFERTGDTAVLEEAVQASRDAVTATPASHPDYPLRLNNLAGSLHALSERTGDSALLAEAVQTFRDAAAATPVGSPGHAERHCNLGIALVVLSESTGDSAVLAEAGRCFTQAAENTSSPATVRMRSYRGVAEVADHGEGSPQEALAAVEAAVGLLPQVAARALIRADREHRLGQQSSLAGQAAATAVAAGRPVRAVELLEQTRGVLVADTLDARSSDLTQLRIQQPSLADEFDKLRAHVDALDHADISAAKSAASSAGGQNLTQRRQDAYAAWDELIERIRGIADFEDFLRPPDIGQIASHTREGPVVFIYTSPSRCDALILADDPDGQVRLVPLTNLTGEDAYRRTSRLIAARQVTANPGTDLTEQIAAQAEILDLLTWMWDTITGPVLATLGHTTTPASGQQWPRVWWCPVGILAYLPLHAAGHHDEVAASQAHPRTVLDRVISSYTTTVRGLAYARSQHPRPGKALIVAVPDPPGALPLPGVAAEASALADLIPDAHLLAHPTRRTVLAALPSHPVSHFACHGYADWANPAASQLVLYDHATTPLTVADVSARHLVGGLAYLSACDTAITSPALANEAVHITAAFHLAGYQHVIGSLWPINDTIARDLACDIYDQLTHHGTGPPDTSRSPHALHNATRRLRDRYPAIPTLWAAHTHTGT
jgi:tetratricopeptide (TPR) repeat protein